MIAARHPIAAVMCLFATLGATGPAGALASCVSASRKVAAAWLRYWAIPSRPAMVFFAPVVNSS